MGWQLDANVCLFRYALQHAARHRYVLHAELLPSMLSFHPGRFPTSPDGPLGCGPGQWGGHPGGVAAFCGRVVIADPGNDRLQAEGRFVREVAGISAPVPRWPLQL